MERNEMKICSLRNENPLENADFKFSVNNEGEESQTTDSHFANYRFSFRFVSFRFANYSKPNWSYYKLFMKKVAGSSIYWWSIKAF